MSSCLLLAHGPAQWFLYATRMGDSLLCRLPELNEETKLDEYTLPRIEDTLDLLSGARYFTTLEITAGYWQVPIEETSQERQPFQHIRDSMSFSRCHSA